MHGDFETAPSVWVSRFPGLGEQTQISRGQLRYQIEIRWSGDGSRLYHRRFADGALMEVEVGVAADGRLVVGEPQALFDERESSLRLDLGFDVDEDGSRFLVVREIPRPDAPPAGAILIQNWLAQTR